jgi:hypothetical protein
MNRLLVSCFALVAATLLAGPLAEAKKPKKMKKPFPVFTLLVKKGILKEDDLTAIKAMNEENMACFEKKKAAKEPFTECFPKVIEKVKAQIALFEKTNPTIQQKGLRKKAEKALAQLRENLTKIEAKAAGGGEAAAKAPAPAPAQ